MRDQGLREWCITERLTLRSCPLQDHNLDATEYNSNPNFGVTSFDNFGHASVIVFQSLFSEGWVQIEEFTTTVSGPG